MTSTNNARQRPRIHSSNKLIRNTYVLQTVIAQSNACLLYLGRKFGLVGSSEAELVRVEQAVCQVHSAHIRLPFLPTITCRVVLSPSCSPSCVLTAAASTSPPNSLTGYGCVSFPAPPIPTCAY